MGRTLDTYTVVKQDIIAQWNVQSVTSQHDDALKQMSNDIDKWWTDFQNSIVISGGTVSGSGIGTWASTSESGDTITVTASVLVFNYEYSTADWYKKFMQAIAQELYNEWTTWSSSWKGSGITFTGTSTATSQSAGTFSATADSNQSLNATAGSQTLPSGFASNVANALVSVYGFNSNITDWMNKWLAAMETAIGTLFTDWLKNTTINAVLSVSGTAAAGTGTGSGIDTGGTVS
jgi:hypothetical protein